MKQSRRSFLGVVLAAVASAFTLKHNVGAHLNRSAEPVGESACVEIEEFGGGFIVPPQFVEEIIRSFQVLPRRARSQALNSRSGFIVSTDRATVRLWTVNRQLSSGARKNREQVQRIKSSHAESA